MRSTCLDPVAEASLAELGYAVIPFLDADQVAQVEEVYWRLGPAPGDPRMTIHFDFQSESPEYKRAVADTLRPVLEPRIDATLDRFHLFSPNFIMKWPGDRSGFAPHQDTSLVDETQHRSVTIWCPLVDTMGADGSDNGILRFLPGSHEFIEWIRAHDPGAFAFEGFEEDIIDRFGVAVPLRAGEAVVFDHRTVHFSMPNSSDRPRLVIAMGLRPQEADLLHYRRGEDDRFDVYAIDDDYYIDLDPFALRRGAPAGYSKVDEVRMSRPVVDRAEFERRCSEVVPHPAPHPATSTRVNADPFCFKCGTQEDLIGGNHRRAEHGNLQLLCRTCAGRLQVTA